MEDARSQPDHSGLQAVENNDYPEVVSESRPMTKDRRSSFHSPEVFTPSTGAFAHNDPSISGPEYFAPQQSWHGQNEKSAAPFNAGSNGQHTPYGQPPTYYDGADQLAEEGGSKQKGKRICGLKRVVFYLVLVIVIVVILAAVLGGVLGAVLGNSHSGNTSNNNSGISGSSTSSAPPSVFSNTGLAVSQPDGSSTVYSYYQDPNGRIIENKQLDNTWSVVGNDVPSSAVVATNAQDGSPLAATTWSMNGTIVRQIFFLDGDGAVMTTNTTDANEWSTPYNTLTDDTAAPGTIALSVCADTAADGQGLDGIRVYYGSSQGFIREVGIDFSESVTSPIWHMWALFPGSDVSSGVNCALSDNVNHLYLRNTSTNMLQQWTWNYVDVSQWTISAQGPSNITAGSDIAVANDGAGTDHIFYEASGNQLTHTLFFGGQIRDYENVAAMAPGSKLTATYNSSGSDTGALVMFRESDDPQLLGFREVDRNGQIILGGTVG